MLGNLLALLCAISWSLSIILLKISGAQIHPLALNLVKNAVGLLLLYGTAVAVEGQLHWPDNPSDTAWLLLSGFLGIGLADGLVLRAMQFLHASQIAILECLFAPFVILLSVLLLDERPTTVMWVGGALIVGALFCISPPRGEKESQALPGRGLGIFLMCVGLLLIAYGIIVVKPVFDRVPLFSLVTIRMMAGVVGSALVMAFVKNPRQKLNILRNSPHKGVLFAACFFSSYVSIVLWVAGYKYLQATVAALLNQTSTIFTMVFAVIFLGERFTRLKVVALGLALAGVIVLLNPI